MRRFINVANKILLTIGIVTAVISVGYVGVLAFLGPGSKRIVYPAVFSTLTQDLLGAGVLLFFVVGITFFVIAQASGFIGAFRKEKYDLSSGAKAVFLVLFATAFPILTSIPLCLLPGQFRSSFGQWQEVGNTDLNNLSFHLTYFRNEGQFDYYLYECDSLIVLCQEIYEESAFILDLAVGPYKLDAPILQADPATNTIALQINDETVYTHRVE